MNKLIAVSLLIAGCLFAQTKDAAPRQLVNGSTGYLWADLGGPPFIANAKTSTYQVLAADFTQCKTIPVASGTFTITLVASGSQPADGQCIRILNYGSGVVTVARSGQNINGATASLTLAAGSAAAPTGVLITSNGTDYFGQILGAGSASFSSLIPTSPNSSVIWGNTGTATPTLDINTSYLNTYWGQLAVANAWTAPNTFVNTATVPNIQLTCSTRPSTPVAFGIICDTGGNFEYWDTVAWKRLANLDGTQTFTNKTINASQLVAASVTPAKMAASTFDAQSDGATITWAIASIKDAFASVTLGGNRTLNITNPVVGGNYVFKITQDVTGTRTLTKGTGCAFKELGSSAATFGLSTAASTVDILTFTFDGTNCYATVGKDYK